MLKIKQGILVFLKLIRGERNTMDSIRFSTQLICAYQEIHFNRHTTKPVMPEAPPR